MISDKKVYIFIIMGAFYLKIYKIKRYYHKIFDNTYSFIGHTHNSYELNIVLNGTLEVTVGKSVLQLSAGDSLFWSPMLFHCNRAVSTGCTEFLSIIFSVDDDAKNEDMITFSRLTPSTDALVKLLINEWESGKQCDDATTALFTALILRLQNGLSTYEREILESTGEDFNDVAETLAREKEIVNCS